MLPPHGAWVIEARLIAIILSPGVVVADYLNITLQYPWHIPLQNSSYNFSQLNRPCTKRVIGLRCCDIIYGDFFHTLLV